MGIIDTGEIYALSVTSDYLTFIYQHSDAHPLKTGQHFAVTLRFQKAGERSVDVIVIAPAAVPPSER